ncbi:MAG: DNA/RNA helicase domain-containing protein [Chloroflexota bacterium]
MNAQERTALRSTLPVAGIDLPWSDPDAAGDLVDDVRVGEWRMPWTAKAEARRLGPGTQKSDFWTSAKEEIDQVGCVYTAQGFEFDCVGIIIGPDLVYRTMDGGWVGQREQSHDRVVRSGVTQEQFTDFVKSTYRVLLTRGLRGCYVYFMDAPTRDFVLSRTERAATIVARRAAEVHAPYQLSTQGDRVGGED